MIDDLAIPPRPPRFGDFGWTISVNVSNGHSTVCSYSTTPDPAALIEFISILPGDVGFKIVYTSNARLLRNRASYQIMEEMEIDIDGSIVSEGLYSYPNRNLESLNRAENLREMLLPLIQSLQQYRAKYIGAQSGVFDSPTFRQTLDNLVSTLEPAQN